MVQAPATQWSFAGLAALSCNEDAASRPGACFFAKQQHSLAKRMEQSSPTAHNPRELSEGAARHPFRKCAATETKAAPVAALVCLQQHGIGSLWQDHRANRELVSACVSVCVFVAGNPSAHEPDQHKACECNTALACKAKQPASTGRGALGKRVTGRAAGVTGRCRRGPEPPARGADRTCSLQATRRLRAWTRLESAALWQRTARDPTAAAAVHRATALPRSADRRAVSRPIKTSAQVRWPRTQPGHDRKNTPTEHRKTSLSSQPPVGGPPQARGSSARPWPGQRLSRTTCSSAFRRLANRDA